MRILLYLALGVSIGGVSGMLGIGGGILLVPALVWLFQLNQAQAAGVTLAVLAVPVTLPGVLQYYREGVIQGEQLRMAAWIAVAFAGGTYLGAVAHSHVPALFLRLFFGLLMMYIAVRFILGSNREVAVAAAGLTSMTLTMLAYLGLRMLGRRHLSRPGLGQHIHAAQEQGRGDIEYHI